MTIKVNEILGACQVLARQDNLKVCVQESIKGAAVAGLGALLGGLLMGRQGIAVGAVVGGLAGSSMSEDFKPVWQVLQEMSLDDQNRLAAHMQNILRNLDINDAKLLMKLVENPLAPGRDILVEGLLAFIDKTLGYK